MKAIIEYPEVKKCYDELMEIINTSKVVDTFIKDKVWCEILRQHGCIGKKCSCFATFINWFDHEYLLKNSEADFCRYKSKIILETRINPRQCEYEQKKNELFLAIRTHVDRYEHNSDKKLILRDLEDNVCNVHVFTAKWYASGWFKYEYINKIDKDLNDEPTIQTKDKSIVNNKKSFFRKIMSWLELGD